MVDTQGLLLTCIRRLERVCENHAGQGQEEPVGQVGQADQGCSSKGLARGEKIGLGAARTRLAAGGGGGGG